MLRGVAALAVVVFHATVYGPRPGYASPASLPLVVFGWGHLGVPLFFVISGFCIHMQWARGAAAGSDRRFEFRAFWKRRLWRLYPPYFIALCFSLGVVVLASVATPNAPFLALYPQPHARWIFADFLAHASMLHGISPRFDELGGNPVYWTLAREEYFYALYLPLLLSRRRWGLHGVVAAVFAIGIGTYVLGHWLLAPSSRWLHLIDTSAPVLWIQWSLGALAVEAYYGLIRLPAWCRSGRLAVVWAAAAFAATEYFPVLEPVLWGMTFFTLLNYLVWREATVGWYRNPIVAWLTTVGIFSYSLYLIHVPVRIVLKQALGRFAVAHTWTGYWLAVAVLASGGYVAALFYFRLIESRFLNKGKTMSRSEHNAPAPGRVHSVTLNAVRAARHALRAAP